MIDTDAGFEKDIKAMNEKHGISEEMSEIAFANETACACLE